MIYEENLTSSQNALLDALEKWLDTAIWDKPDSEQVQSCDAASSAPELGIFIN